MVRLPQRKPGDEIDSFLNLTDTPNSYDSQAGKSVAVNVGETALEFVTNTTTDEKAKVSSNDTTAGYLNGKLVAGDGITLTENDNGEDETLTIENTAEETDPVYGAWIAGPPNVSEFTNDSGYLTEEEDTLDSVCTRDAITTAVISIGGINDAEDPPALSISPYNRQLLGIDGEAIVLDWDSLVLYNSAHDQMVSWDRAVSEGVFFPSGIGDGNEFNSVMPTTRELIDTEGNLSCNWNSRVLVAGDGMGGLSWVNSNLVEIAASIQIGASEEGVDYTLTITGFDTAGVITWVNMDDYFRFEDDIMLAGGENIILATTTGTNIGTDTDQLLAFYGATPVDQPATVNDPSGGAVQDAEARTAIGAIIDRLQELGLIA